jgi:hypothetical protein
VRAPIPGPDDDDDDDNATACGCQDRTTDSALLLVPLVLIGWRRRRSDP